MGVKIPGDSFSGIPLCFCWCLGITSFWRPLGSSLEFSCGRLGTNSVWRPFGSTLGFVTPRYFFSGIPPCFPPLEFTLIVCLRGTTFPPLGVYCYSPFLGNYIKAPYKCLLVCLSFCQHTIYACTPTCRLIPGITIMKSEIL